MIFPDEYKFVGIKDRERRGESIYFATEYLISRDGPALYHVTSRGSGFMREVVELESIASGLALIGRERDLGRWTMRADALPATGKAPS